MGDFIANMLREERDKAEAEERAQNNGQLSAGAQAAHAAADRSEATTRQMQGYSYAAGGLGTQGPSGPFLGRWDARPDMNVPSDNVAGPLNWKMPQQQGYGAAGYSGSQQGNSQQPRVYGAAGYPGYQQGNAQQQQGSGAAGYSGNQQGNAQQQSYASQGYPPQQRRGGS